MIMPDAGGPPLLKVDIVGKSLTRGAERLEIIAGLRFDLPRGQVTCLLGPSGCGKTTALRIITGLDDAFEGSLTPAPTALRLGVVFQDPRLLPWLTVEHNVRLVAPTLDAARLDTLLAAVGLLEWRRHRPNQISGGMARRVALARALAVEPDLLVLDEAFVSLDEDSAAILRAVVFDAAERRGASVLMVTHDVREAMLHSDTILVLAPRPTCVRATVPLTTPRAERTETWIGSARSRLLGTASMSQATT